MKYLRALFFILGLYLCITSCRQGNKHESTETVDDNASLEKDKIQTLMRKTLVWAFSENSIDLEPVILKDSVYIGFDLKKHKTNLQTLKKTGFFSIAFIENYNQIILTLDKKLRNKEIVWHEGDLPEFDFAGEANPWCSCQDFPDDKSDPWKNIVVQIIDLNNQKGNLIWKWGNLNDDYDKSWKEFEYKFSVEKENGKWNISKMEGFDFDFGKK